MLKVKDLTYKIEQHGKSRTILHNISFSLRKGEILGIAGESGSGKTTLAKILIGLIRPTSGEILFTEENVQAKENFEHVQLLFQNNGELVNPFRKVGNMLIETIEKFERIDHQERLHELIELVNIDKSLLQRKGYALSGGEQQRVAFARILAARPELIILDEPFSAQDIYASEILFELIEKLNKKEKMTFIMISHDLNAIKKLAERSLIMFEGEIVEEGPTIEILSSPKHTYTKYLLKCIDYDLPDEKTLRGFRNSNLPVSY